MIHITNELKIFLKIGTTFSLTIFTYFHNMTLYFCSFYYSQQSFLQLRYQFIQHMIGDFTFISFEQKQYSVAIRMRQQHGMFFLLPHLVRNFDYFILCGMHVNFHRKKNRERHKYHTNSILNANHAVKIRVYITSIFRVSTTHHNSSNSHLIDIFGILYFTAINMVIFTNFHDCCQYAIVFIFPFASFFFTFYYYSYYYYYSALSLLVFFLLSLQLNVFIIQIRVL